MDGVERETEEHQLFAGGLQFPFEFEGTHVFLLVVVGITQALRPPTLWAFIWLVLEGKPRKTLLIYRTPPLPKFHATPLPFLDCHFTRS